MTVSCPLATAPPFGTAGVEGSRVSHDLERCIVYHLFRLRFLVTVSLTALLYAPESGMENRRPPKSVLCLTSLLGNSVFPVDGYIIADAAALVIKPVV